MAKHARAARVGLTLSYMEHQVALDVRDDGRGFDPRRSHRGTAGSAWSAMRQRIEALSGTLQVESEPGAGTGDLRPASRAADADRRARGARS